MTDWEAHRKSATGIVVAAAVAAQLARFAADVAVCAGFVPGLFLALGRRWT